MVALNNISHPHTLATLDAIFNSEWSNVYVIIVVIQNALPKL